MHIIQFAPILRKTWKFSTSASGLVGKGPLICNHHLRHVLFTAFEFLPFKIIGRPLDRVQHPAKKASGAFESPELSQRPSTTFITGFFLNYIFCGILVQSSIPNVTSLTWFTYNMFALYFFCLFPNIFISLWHWIAAFVECLQTSRIKEKNLKNYEIKWKWWRNKGFLKRNKVKFNWMVNRFHLKCNVIQFDINSRY